VLRAQVLSRVRVLRAPLIWRSIAATCRVGRAAAPNWRTWSARMGYSLRHAGLLNEATAAYVAAITGYRASKDWSDVVTNIPRAGIAGESPAKWYYGLGQCLLERGKIEAAAPLIRAASLHQPGNARWLETWARIETQTGDLQAAVDARRRVVELHGQTDPSARLKLATSLNRAGLWSEATRLLVDNVTQHPNHAPSYQLLAAVSASRSLWGGTFVETLPDRRDGKFSLGGWSPPATSDGMLDSSTPAALAVDALQRATDLAPSRTTWRGALADALLAVGNVKAAIAQYEVALNEAEASNDRWAFNVKQRWQFQYERCYHLLGESRVEDPLFDAAVDPAGTPAVGTRRIAGLFNAEFNYLGLSISGLLGSADCEHVNIFFNGEFLRAVNVTRDSFLPQFKLTIKRKTMGLFPSRGILEVRTADGEQINGPGGAAHIVLSVPHGDGRLLSIIGDGGMLNKKGEIEPSPAEMKHREDRDLEIYSRVCAFFDEHFGRPLFLLYGTLLGYHRAGDFIPGDDDFDAGYVSDKTDPVAVKEEAKEIVVELVRAGFTVSLNRRGRLFRVQLEHNEPNGSHVDVHQIWFQDGNVWIHNVVAMPSGRENFLPVVDGRLRGVTVSVPRRPELFLRGNYGPGWTVPDPGFRYYPSEVNPAVRRNLDKALITVGEYKSLARRIQEELRDTPTAGRFVSIGSQDLYPLSDFMM
jgi:tetratricopeptide (TPR) repeat protein